MKLINNAKEYQRLWGPWKEFENETYSYWTQQVGESYVAYMNGKNFSTAQRQTVEFAACQTGKPQLRYFHASAAIELSPKGSVAKEKTKNVVLVHGGSDGSMKNDSWVFVNGLIDSSKVPYTAQPLEILIIQLMGQAVMDRPMLIDGLEQKSCNQQQRTLHCNTCNRWHKVRLSKRSRSSLECDIFGTCPRHDPKEHWVYLQSLAHNYPDSSTNLLQSVERLQQMKRMVQYLHLVEKIKDTGRTRQLWYLSKLPYPRNSLLTSTSYESDLTAEWYCAKVYGNAENASSYHDSIYRNRNENVACDLNSSKVIKSTNGTIDSGVLEPQSRCKWIIDYPDTYTNTTEMHVINFEFSRLDLTDSTATSCRNMVSIYNIPHNGGDKSILFRGCQYDNIKSNSFFSTLVGSLK